MGVNRLPHVSWLSHRFPTQTPTPQPAQEMFYSTPQGFPTPLPNHAPYRSIGRPTPHYTTSTPSPTQPNPSPPHWHPSLSPADWLLTPGLYNIIRLSSLCDLWQLFKGSIFNKGRPQNCKEKKEIPTKSDRNGSLSVAKGSFKGNIQETKATRAGETQQRSTQYWAQTLSLLVLSRHLYTTHMPYCDLRVCTRPCPIDGCFRWKMKETQNKKSEDKNDSGWWSSHHNIYSPDKTKG